MRHLLAIILTLLLVLPVNAEDSWIVEPEQGQVSKNIVFVLDISGSMQPEELSRGISTMMTLLEQPIDEMNVAVIAFSDGTYVWPGPKQKGPLVEQSKLPSNWLEMPNKDGLNELHAWVKQLKAGGGTNMHGAIREAVCQNVSPLTIIVISDGQYTSLDDNLPNPHADLLKYLTELNIWRVDKKFEPYTLGFILTQHITEQSRSNYKDFCKANKFFYLQLNSQ